ncbi:MAG: hypothetical protein COA78_34220 [Blastopirellula sp.]|nr:MAG: hypothetical protein COA78_34220 [Blastopirellula sp.]
MLVDSNFLILGLAVFGASVLQAATGIGYGVIVGPIFLVLLNGTEAFQISTAHNLLIALILLPFVLAKIDRTILKHLIVGSCIGIPAGFLLQLTVSITFLKLFSAVIVGLITISLGVSMATPNIQKSRIKVSSWESRLIGMIAGFMGGTLAMPGPATSTWMSVRGWNKEAVRSTVLSFFVFAYGANAVLHVMYSDISQATMRLTLTLAPVVVLGILFGNIISKFVSERVFKIILLIVLILTVLGLLASL